MKPEWEKIYEPFLGQRKLNLGCANNPEAGWTNLDKNPKVKPDVVHDLERLPLPFGDSSFDTILGSHVFEHVRNLIPLMEEFHRVLAPGGHLIAVTPYGSSDDAWDSPHHVRGFSEKTWYYFDQRLYQQPGAGNGATEGYQGNFQVVEINLIPYLQFQRDPELEFKQRHWRNVIQELHAVLRVEKGTA